MKKIVSVVLIVMISVVLTGCELFGLAETTVAMRNMDKLDSYKMDMSFQIDGEEFMTSYANVVGNYQELHVMGTTIEMFTIDEQIYSIVDWYGLPVLELDEELSEDEEGYDDFSLFDDIDFEQDGDYWVLKGEQEIFEGIVEIRILIEDSYIVEMILIGTIEEIDMEVVIEYSRFNDLDIDIPYYLSESEKDYIESHAESLQIYDIRISSGGFSINGMPTIDCSYYNNTCFVESEPGFYYDLETQKVREQESETEVPYIEYVSSTESLYSTLEFFEFVHFIQELVEKAYK